MIRAGRRIYSPDSPDERSKVTWGLLRRVLNYARPYRWWILWMLILTLVTTGLSLLTPLILRDLIDRTLPDRDVSRLIALIVGLLTIPLLTGALNVWQRQINARVGEGVVYDLRTALFSHLQRMSLRFFTHTKVGELMSRLNNDVVGAQNAISNTFVNIVTSLIQAVVLLSVMFALEWRLTLISIAILPLFLVAARHLGNRMRKIARLQLDLNANMNAMMNEMLNISGALLVKLFGRIAQEDTRFEERAARVRDSGVQRAVSGTLFFVSVGLLSAIGTALVYGVGGYLVIQSTLTIGTIVALGLYLSSLYGALQSLTNAPIDFATSLVSFERVFEVLDLPLEIASKSGAHLLQDVRGVLEFDDVTFRYSADERGLLKDVRRFGQMQDVKAVLSGDSKEEQRDFDDVAEDEELAAINQTGDEVLEHISFRAEPGHLVALVGPSGAGKTTLTYLIPRLYDPTAGRILIDGHDLRDVTLASLTAQIGMVTQETYLFHDTLLCGDQDRDRILHQSLEASRLCLGSVDCKPDIRKICHYGASIWTLTGRNDPSSRSPLEKIGKYDKLSHHRDSKLDRNGDCGHNRRCRYDYGSRSDSCCANDGSGCRFRNHWNPSRGSCCRWRTRCSSCAT